MGRGGVGVGRGGVEWGRGGVEVEQTWRWRQTWS